MNLKNNPTKKQLRALLRECDDNADNHILYVTVNGDVKIEEVGGTTPAIWEEDHEGIMQFRLETFDEGNGYTGVKAANDQKWVDRVYDAITKAWASGDTGYVDDF